MLTADDINLILSIIGRDVVVAPNKDFKFYITSERAQGYSNDPIVSAIQAKLSIMLEVVRRRG